MTFKKERLFKIYYAHVFLLEDRNRYHILVTSYVYVSVCLNFNSVKRAVE